MTKKFAGWLLIVMLLCTLLPSQVLGADLAKNDSLNTSTSISLEKAIQNVKQNFTIPSNLTEFTSSFNRYGEHQRWSLRWSSQNEEDGNFQAEVDAVSGELVNMNRWYNTDNNSLNKTPSLSVAEARKIGQNLLARLLPAKISSLTLQDDSSLIPLGTYDSPRYNMTWKRTYQGVNVAMDYVQMEIDMQTGEVSNYNLNWTDKTFPNPAKIITADQARQTFISQEILKLQYFNHMVRGQQAQPQLIYGIRHPSNGMIDALSGQPLSAGGYNDLTGGAGWHSSIKFSLDSIAVEAPVVLSPEEQKEVENSAQYISQAKAIELVKKWLPIANNMELESATLEKDWQNPDTRCWSLNWGNNTSNKGIASNVWAQIDALSGELIAFNLNLSPEKEFSNSDLIDQKAAQSLAENFIKTMQPQRWSEVKLDDQNSIIRPLDINQATWSFEYLRLVNGVICPNNGIEVTIDAGTKQVSSYRLNWSKNKFPSAQKAIGSKQANDIFLKAAPLTLSYTMVISAKGNEELKLVYLPEVKNAFYMIDALSGTYLNEEGNAITDNPQAYVFNDIKGHFGEKEINILGQAGILGEYNTSFHPDENIKLIGLLRAMLGVKEGVYSIQRLNDEEVFKRCQNLNWVETKSPLDSSVSRELLAQLMIRFLNIDYLSQVQGIYQLPYSDTAGMSPELKAYAALCWGLNIIKADGKTFNPQHTVSRAEAATALVHTLSIHTNP